MLRMICAAAITLAAVSVFAISSPVHAANAATIAARGHGEVTEFSARRRHHAKRHSARRHQARHQKVRRHHAARPVRTASGFSAECNVTMPCIGAPPAYAGHAAKQGVKVVSKRAARHAARMNAQASYGDYSPSISGSFGQFGGSLVSIARSQIGNGAIYGRRNLWCARFMNYVLQRAGHHGTGSDMARSFAHYGRRISGPRVGAIAVMSRGRRGGHVGIVSGLDAQGNPIIISGNHGHRVAEAAYPRSRIYAYVVPN